MVRCCCDAYYLLSHHLSVVCMDSFNSFIHLLHCFDFSRKMVPQFDITHASLLPRKADDEADEEVSMMDRVDSVFDI
jgi:hypothetical protein